LRLQHLIMEGFGRFSGKRRLNFEPGLNIIKGPNESGKSTILQALVTTLFTPHNTKAKEVLSLASWGREGGFRLELSFEDDDGKPYQLVKEFGRGLGELSGDGKRLTSTEAINKHITELCGCPNREFFLATACVRQGELAIEQEAGVAERLQGIGSGSPAGDVGGVLTEIHTDATSRAQNADGPAKHLVETDAQLAGVEKAISELTGKVRRLLELRAKHVELAEKQDNLAEKYKHKKELLENNQTLQKTEAELIELAGRSAQLDKARICQKELEELNEELDSIPNCNQEDAEYILSLQGALLHSTEKPPGLSKKTKRISMLLSVIGAIGFLGGAIWGAVSGFSTLPIVVINIGALTTLLGLFWVLLSRRMASTLGEKRSLLDELGKALQKVGYRNYDDFDKDRHLRNSIEEKISGKRNLLSGLTGGKELGEFEKIMHTDQLRLDYLYKQKEKLLPYALKRDINSAEFAEALLHLEKEVSQLEVGSTGLKEELLTIEGSLASIDADPEQLTGLEEEKERLLEWKEFYVHRIEVLLKAKELLGIAYQQTLANAVPTIKKELETYISTITGGRYSEVELDASSLTISAKAPETGEMVNIEKLSTATQDQFYLVARLGLVRHLTGGVRPPLILDDITVNFDDQRREATKKILTELSKDYQILLFTCHDFHDDWGRLIELEA